ncbi:MAG: GntR family transcriptional regulator [Candidatus Dormibacteria bacterium]
MRSISDHAYATLSRAIETCEIPPGAPFNERDTAARLGMSRTPFRQALHRLVLEGLVVVVPKRGTFVAPLDPSDIADNMAVREAVEVGMVQRLLADGHDLDWASIDEYLGLQKGAVDAGDTLGFLRADEDFHQYILASAGNRRALEAAQRAWLHVNRARYLQPFTRAHMRRSIAEHKEIVVALRAGDAEGARWAIRRHLGDPLDRTLEDLRNRFPDAFSLGAARLTRVGAP